jgi:hypothetical protein
MKNQDPVVFSAERAAAAGMPLTRHQRWALTRRKILQLVGGLIMEKNDDGLYVISIGRVALWAAFLPAIGIWIYGKGGMDGGEAVRDISPNHFNMLMTLIAYNMGKKITDIAKIAFNRKDPEPSAVDKDADGPG